MRAKSIILMVALVAVAPVLAGCESTDFLDKLDFFHLNDKKKLPGERKAVFPDGVPGVSDGVPPDLVKGYQPPAEPVEAEAPPPAEKPKPRVAKREQPGTAQPKTAQTKTAKPKPARISVQPASKTVPAQPQPQQAQQQTLPWPTPQASQQQTGAQSPWPAPAAQSSPWPSSPAPGTFQR